MAGHDFDALYRALKAGQIAPSYYLFGREHLLKDEAIRAIRDVALDPAVQDFNYDVRSAPRTSPEEIEALITTLPMMAERRVVVLRDIEGWNKRSKGRTALLSVLRSPVPETVLIMVQGDAEKPDADLAKGSQRVSCDPLPPARASKWAARKAAEADLRIDPAALDHLVRTAECDLGVIATELAKLAGLGGSEGEEISVAQVEALLGVRHGETPGDWRDAILAGDLGRAARLLDPVLAQPGVSGVRLVSLLGQAIIGLAIARAAYDAGRRGGNLEREIFATIRRIRLWGVDWGETARTWSAAAPHWPRPRVRTALAAAARADEALKTTTLSDERGILFDLIMQCAAAQEEAA